jgi:hypothetical protein
MREKALVKRIMKQLRAGGAKVLKLHGDAFIEMGTPDLLGCYRGRAFAIEAKVDGRPTTETQDLRLKEWEAAGAVTIVAREGFDAAVFLRMMRTGRL